MNAVVISSYVELGRKKQRKMKVSRLRLRQGDEDRTVLSSINRSIEIADVGKTDDKL